MKILFILMILFSTYDKYGMAIPVGDRLVHMSPYKIIFLILVALYLLSYSVNGSTRTKGIFDRRLWRFMWLFVILQTAASIAGGFYTAGSIFASSEFYHFIQRSTFIFIPMLALKNKMPPREVLKWFIFSVLIHYAFIALQFISPLTYGAFVEFLHDPIKVDTSIGWGIHGVSRDFIGLQSSSNYGSFAASFGLLILVFTAKTSEHRLFVKSIVGFVILIVLLGPSRAVLIQVAVTLLVYLNRRHLLLRGSTFAWAALILIVAISVILVFGAPQLEDFSSLYRFTGERMVEGMGDYGKISILYYSLELFRMSPIVGWGQQKFRDLTYDLGNIAKATSETHFYFISVLVSTGLVGFILYLMLYFKILKALWKNRNRDYIIFSALFLGVSIYNFAYSAGHLDVFACFNGIAAYYALTWFRLKDAGPHEGIKPSDASLWS